MGKLWNGKQKTHPMEQESKGHQSLHDNSPCPKPISILGPPTALLSFRHLHILFLLCSSFPIFFLSSFQSRDEMERVLFWTPDLSYLLLMKQGENKVQATWKTVIYLISALKRNNLGQPCESNLGRHKIYISFIPCPQRTKEKKLKGMCTRI